MSIVPVAFDEETKVYTMYHDDIGYRHTFETNVVEIQYNTDPFGNPDYTHVVVPCPKDDFISVHPIAGGAAPPMVQGLFANIYTPKGCPCGTVNSGEDSVVNLGHAKLHCEQMDGIGRWQVPDNSGEADSILINDASSYIVGLGPFKDVPVGYTEHTLVGRERGFDDLQFILENTYTQFIAGQIIKGSKP